MTEEQSTIKTYWESDKFDGDIRVIELDFPGLKEVLKKGKQIFIVQLDLAHSKKTGSLPVWTPMAYHLDMHAAIESGKEIESEAAKMIQMAEILSFIDIHNNDDEMN